jgi:hypothetical protein
MASLVQTLHSFATYNSISAEGTHTARGCPNARQIRTGFLAMQIIGPTSFGGRKKGQENLARWCFFLAEDDPASNQPQKRGAGSPGIGARQRRRCSRRRSASLCQAELSPPRLCRASAKQAIITLISADDPDWRRHTFAVIRRLVDKVIAVADADLVETMRFFASRMKLVVELTGCCSGAGLPKEGRSQRQEGRHPGVSGRYRHSALCRASAEQ